MIFFSYPEHYNCQHFWLCRKIFRNMRNLKENDWRQNSAFMNALTAFLKIELHIVIQLCEGKDEGNEGAWIRATVFP